MTNDTLQFIAEEFPAAWPDSPPPPAMLVHAYNKLRDRAIALEKAAIKVAQLNPAAGEIGAGMLATIVQEARDALNP
jgi:hypothetical protein